MTMRGLLMVSAIAALAVGQGGCRAREVSRGWSGKDTARAERPLLAPALAAAAIDQMLYEENLISVPEVSVRTKQAVLRVSRDKHARDSVMPALHRWLEDWAASHPAETKAARLAGGGSGRPKRTADAPDQP